MFEWLFPNWSHPAFLTALVGARVFLNMALTAIVVKSSSSTSRSTVVATVLTALSAVLLVLVLRGTLGLNASYLEFILQLSLVILAGYSVYSNPSNVRLRVVGAVSLGTIALLLVTIPLYGEATVAP